ncbi:MAG: hypothetical protein IJ668_02235 [Selenomonadaceae bacterium]|nr:hypothetical protein [Selenomonadaceae bacterium]
MKVILWFQSPQLPLFNYAINVIAQTHGEPKFVGVIMPEQMGGGVRATR